MGKNNHQGNEGGFGNPPKNHQYQPGQSGNPKGRPKGSKNVHQVLSKILKEKISITDAGKKMMVEKLEGALRVLVNKSFEGRPQSLKLLLDLLKEADGVDQTATEGAFTDDDHAALMENLDWLEVVRSGRPAEKPDGSD